MSPYLDLALAALHDLRDDLHRQANKQFFRSRFVSYGDYTQHEATVRNCLQLLQSLPRQDSFPAQINEHPELAG